MELFLILVHLLILFINIHNIKCKISYLRVKVTLTVRNDPDPIFKGHRRACTI